MDESMNCSARSAARCPAASPSNKYTMRLRAWRDSTRICWRVSAVPSVATALVMPFSCMAMTSVYPSHTTAVPVAVMDAFALSSANSTRPLWNNGVSCVLRYFGSPVPTTRPPKAMHSPASSQMGNITRSKNLSRSRPSRPVSATLAWIISSGLKPFAERWRTRVPLPGAKPSCQVFGTCPPRFRPLRYWRAAWAFGDGERMSCVW